MKSCFVLNNIRSTYNVGSIFRTADGLGWDVILQGYTPHPLVENDTRLPYVVKKVEKELKKTAVHAFEFVDWKYLSSQEDTLNILKKNKMTIISLEVNVENSISIYDFKKHSLPVALVLGNEIDGVSKFFLENSDTIVSLPMSGHNSSLNVSTAGAVAGYYLENNV